MAASKKSETNRKRVINSTVCHIIGKSAEQQMTERCNLREAQTAKRI